MSRRLSIQYKNAGKPKGRVKFPDEIVLLEHIKDNDIDSVKFMFRRNSFNVDINKMNDSGITALHQAVLDNSMELAVILIENKANVNIVDEDSWTPLHTACAMGFYDMTRLLLESGANPHIVTTEGERPLDLIEQSNFPLISLLLNFMKEYKIDESTHQETNHGKQKKETANRKKTALPTDPTLLAEFTERTLSKILKTNKFSVDDMINEIKNTFGDSTIVKSKQFISLLTNAICDSCMTNLYHNECKLNTEALSKKLAILSKFIDSKQELELECLYAVQELDFKFNHPPGLIRNIFDTFYYGGLMKKETFKTWKKNENPYQDDSSHKITITLLKNFFDFN